MKNWKLILFVGVIGMLAGLFGPPVWRALAEPIRLRGAMHLQAKDDTLDATMLQLKNTAGTVVYAVSVTGGATGGAVTIGSTGTPIADSYANSAVINFGSIMNTTTDSSAIAVPGAALGDPCDVGTDLDATWVAGSDFSCRVSAADAVKVRHQCVGTCDPGSDTFRVRTFDP